MEWKTYRTRPMHLLASVTIFAGLVMLPLRGHTDSASAIEVGRFFSASKETGLPNGWRPLTFPKIRRHTRHEVIKEGETTVVRATSTAAASGLVHEARVDLREYPVLQWHWKASTVVSKGDVRTKQGDDYAARIYITFQYDPDKVDWSTKVKYKMGRLLLGDIPLQRLTTSGIIGHPEGRLWIAPTPTVRR